MPTYTYRCAKCESVLEVRQKMTDEPLTRCEKCGTKTLSKVITNGNFQLKGKGWFKDGY